MPENPASWEDIADFIQDAARQMREFGLTTLDVEHDGSRVRIKIEAPRIVHTEPATSAPVMHATLSPSADSMVADLIVTSPMIGTFYASPSPSDPPFVEEGDSIEVGQVIGIIEAMKIMNEITSEHEGTISKILVKNAQAVEYGQPLFHIAPAD
ncbi:MAG TPA: acetyl-CoA carboxylase biotin carboxyl carrier protein [Thermomicrobiales bacterium]|nr:acetyl-CoA carboxylase biotin carboxyl carrier protein [Thermomicrobiales bacterium]